MQDTEQTALSLLEAAPKILREILAGLPNSILTADLDRGWSPHRILAHEVDVEPIFAERLRRIVDEDHPTITSVDPMATLTASGLESRPTIELLDRFADLRSETLSWLRTLTAADAQRTAVHDTIGEFTVANLIHYWPTHDFAHINGIRRMLMAVLRHEAGPCENLDI
ncbi:MAG: DinB family protein [Chloroflexota bacterium]